MATTRGCRDGDFVLEPHLGVGAAAGAMLTLFLPLPLSALLLVLVDWWSEVEVVPPGVLSRGQREEAAAAESGWAQQQCEENRGLAKGFTAGRRSTTRRIVQRQRGGRSTRNKTAGMAWQKLLRSETRNSRMKAPSGIIPAPIQFGSERHFEAEHAQCLQTEL